MLEIKLKEPQPTCIYVDNNKGKELHSRFTKMLNDGFIFAISKEDNSVYVVRLDNNYNIHIGSQLNNIDNQKLIEHFEYSSSYRMLFIKYKLLFLSKEEILKNNIK
jgi:hypothetical protein